MNEFHTPMMALSAEEDLMDDTYNKTWAAVEQERDNRVAH